MRDVPGVLKDVSGSLDLTQPACVIIGCLLHLFPAAEARALVAGYIAALVPGSYLVLSLGRGDGPRAVEFFRAYCGWAGPVYNHSAADVASFFGSLPLVPPGLVDAREWRPDVPLSAPLPPARRRDARRRRPGDQVTGRRRRRATGRRHATGRATPVHNQTLFTASGVFSPYGRTAGSDRGTTGGRRAAGIRWAYESAVRRSLESFCEADGHDHAWLGMTRFTLFRDRLDRVFSCERYAVSIDDGTRDVDVLYAELSEHDLATMPRIAPGHVTRTDLYGSAGWTYGDRRFLLAAGEFGRLRTLPWSERSTTKQIVAMQVSPDPHPRQPSLFEERARGRVIAVRRTAARRAAPPRPGHLHGRAQP